MTDFNPSKMIEDAIKAGFDPGAVTEFDDRDLPWAKNIVSWCMDSDFLDTKTVYPIQLQSMLRLFGDVCPHCSDWEFYSKDFTADLKSDEILSRIQLLDDGRCPKCKTTRLDHYNDNFWYMPDEVDLLWGMRCVSQHTRIYTKNRGIIEFNKVEVGDELTHGTVAEKIYVGKKESLRFTTDYNWIMSGAKQSHIVPTLNTDCEIEHKLMKDCKVGDVVLLYSANMWAESRFQLGAFRRDKLEHGQQAKDFCFPTEVTPELARLVGYLVSDGQYTRKYNLRIVSSNPDIDADIKRCCLAVFGEEPKLEEYRECATVPFYKCWTLNGVAVMEWLNWIGLKPETSHDKIVPDFILRSPKEIVCEFLAGLFDGDGGVHAETMPNGRQKVKVYYTTVSKTLAEQVRILLLNLGIVTRCSTMRLNGFAKANTYLKNYDPDEKGVAFNISTKNSNSVRIFQENVHLASEQKKKTLDKAKGIKGRPYFSLPLGAVAGTQTTTYKNAPEKLKKLIDEGYFPVKIKVIKDGPIEEMMDIHVPGTNVYTGDGFLHHNSGKSAVAGGMIGSYVLHRYLKLPDPAGYFEQLRGQQLYMRFIAITLKQAKESNWMQFCRAIETSNWFSQYHDLLDFYAKKKGVEVYKWLTEEFSYFHKGISGYVQGAALDTSRGRTGIFSCIDEIGWFGGGEDAKRANAKETYIAYEKSAATIRNKAAKLFVKGDYNVPTGYLCAVSSTMSKSDYIMRLIKTGKTDPKKVTSHKASWEVNPDIDPVFLDNEKRKDPKAFARDYGSIPPFADDPFIDSEDLVLKSAKLEEPYWNVKIDKSIIGPFFDASQLDRDKSIPYCLSIDMGKSDCGYALTLLKLKEDDFKVVQVAGAWALYPDRTHGEVVDFDGMYQKMVATICEKVNVRLVLYDQWQSQSQIDAIRKLGIDAQQYSLTYRDFIAFRAQLYQGLFETVAPEIPLDEVDDRPEPIEELLYKRPYMHLLWQMLSVSEVGTKITKGDGHDDLFRAMVLGATFLWNEKYKANFEYKGGVQIRRVQQRKGLVLAGGSRSGGQYTGGNSSTHNVVMTNNRVLGVFVPRGGRK